MERYEIEYQIIQKYSDVNRKLAVDLYAPVFDLLFSLVDTANCIPVFTTNYDTAIEEFCEAKTSDYDLVDGFRAIGRDFVWSKSQFHDFVLRPEKRTIVLFKLHGSVNWIYLRARDQIVRTQPFLQAIDSARYKNALIYPAVHKVATDDPYFTAYDYYGRCCERARMFLTIGYSFRDYDALARLRSALSLNPSLALAIWDPNAAAILDKLKIDAGRPTAIEQLFGSPDGLLLLQTSVSTLVR